MLIIADSSPQNFENIPISENLRIFMIIYDNFQDIQANDLPLTSFVDLGGKKGGPHFITVLFRRVVKRIQRKYKIIPIEENIF